MVSTYLTRSPKKITTRNTSARKIYTASRWVCLQHSGTNMYQSHWKSSSFPSFEVKTKTTKSEWNQHPHSRSFFWTIQNSSFQSACGLVKSMGLSGHPGSACFPEPKRLSKRGERRSQGRLPCHVAERVWFTFYPPRILEFEEEMFAEKEFPVSQANH